jgi:hypothetical protein
LNANRQSDSFTSLEIAPRNSNHIPGGTTSNSSTHRVIDFSGTLAVNILGVCAVTPEVGFTSCTQSTVVIPSSGVFADGKETRAANVG